MTTSQQTPTSTTGVLEHVNLTVRDPDKTAALLCRLFDWEVRWRGESKLAGRTVHVGTENQYLAIYVLDPNAPSAPASYANVGGLNHLGIEVSDLDAVEARVIGEGLIPHTHGDYEPGRRFYFDDLDGIEYEVVSY